MPTTTLRHVVLPALIVAAFGRELTAQPLPPVPVPIGNPITVDKANLGKTLFWEELLSSTRTMACGTCHLPSSGGSDPRSRLPESVHPGPDNLIGTPDDILGSLGVASNEADGSYTPIAPFGLDAQVTGRKAPSIVNAAFFSRALFWDGRATSRFTDPLTGGTVLANDASLESQAAGPPVSDAEMAFHGRDWDDVANTLSAARPLALASDVPQALDTWIGTRTYPELFAQAFGSPGVTPARLLMAIATYERTLISGQAPIDAFLAGQQNALSPQERRGFQIFNGPGRCNVCHAPPLFARRDGFGVGPQAESFFNIGVRPTNEDLGRFVVTGQPQHRGAFKIPSLRNVGLRAPYFHNGGMRSLEDVVDFYNRGGDFRQNQTPLIRPLGLGPPQRADLVAFLRNALTDPRVANELPPFDRPTLYSETQRVPGAYGAATAGSGNTSPRLIALEPPMLGNPNLTVALTDALGGAPAIIVLGVAPAPGTNLLGASLWVDPTGALLFAWGALAGTGPGGGHGSLMWSVPATASLAGTQLFAQGFVLDAGAPSGLAATRGSELTLFSAR